MNNIVLIGMPGVGKSTVGVILAKELGYQFVDADLLIQKQEGCLLKDIIEEKGIDGFLEIEDKVNAGIEADRAVISPGGSVVYCENAMKHFKEIGTIVYLHTSYNTIKKRIGDPKKRGVVLKEGQTLKMLYEERKVLFEKYADIIISEDGLTLDQTIGKVVKSLSEN